MADKLKRYENVSAQYKIKIYVLKGFAKIKDLRRSFKYIIRKKEIINWWKDRLIA